jgi:hypothetical protein
VHPVDGPTRIRKEHLSDFIVFDDNICDTLMCVDMVQNLSMIEFMLKSKKNEA